MPAREALHRAAVALLTAGALLASAPRPAAAEEVWPAVELGTRKPLTTALAPGDRIEVEAAVSFSFRADRLDEPLAIQARARLDVRERAPGLIVVGARIEVASVRYRGPSLAFALDRPEVGPSLDTVASLRGGRQLTPVPTADPLLDDLVERQRRVAAAAALLHGVEVEAVVTPGREPWVSLLGPVAVPEPPGSAAAGDGDRDPVDGTRAVASAASASRRAAGIIPADDLVRDRLLRGLLLIAFPPVPLDLDRDDAAYTAGQARHVVLSSAPSLHPLPGEELRVRALEPTTFARAFYAFEAVNDLGGLQPIALRLRADERARVHPRLGLASFREVDTRTEIVCADGRVIEARARWTALLTAASVEAVHRARGGGGAP